MEDTLVLIKPDATRADLIGAIIGEIEQQGLSVQAIRIGWFDDEDFEDLYREHEGKSFYDGNMSFMCSGNVVAVWFKGVDAVSKVRKLAGATDPQEADPNTIRGRWGAQLPQNCIHASDSVEIAGRELRIFFVDPQL